MNASLPPPNFSFLVFVEPGQILLSWWESVRLDYVASEASQVHMLWPAAIIAVACFLCGEGEVFSSRISVMGLWQSLVMSSECLNCEELL